MQCSGCRWAQAGRQAPRRRGAPYQQATDGRRRPVPQYTQAAIEIARRCMTKHAPAGENLRAVRRHAGPPLQRSIRLP